MKTGSSQIRHRLPKDRKLPTRFDDLVRAKLPFSIEWNDLDAYCLKRSALQQMVPFLHLGDGGLFVLWYRTEEPAVVYIDAHGELPKVVASDFDNFLKCINARCSGVPDIDEEEQAFSIPGVRGKPKRLGVASLQKKLEKWFKEHTSLLEPVHSPEAELLRQHVYEIGKAMLRDGLSKVYTLSSSWWDWDFRIVREGEDFAITYLDFGKWHALPAKYKLAKEVVELLTMVKSKKRRQYELSISSPGIVSVDQERELLLMPPDRGTD